MKRSFDRGRFKLYIWLGIAYLSLWLFSDFVRYPDTFAKRAWNNIWLVSYLVVLNFILFEYTLTFVKLTWKRVLIWPFLLFAQLMLYSFGLYGWRFIGIQLHLYFPLIIHPSIEAGVTYIFPYSVGAIVFFAIAKHIYDYRKLKAAAQQLRIDKQEAELNYLKSQTNPHF